MKRECLPCSSHWSPFAFAEIGTASEAGPPPDAHLETHACRSSLLRTDRFHDLHQNIGMVYSWRQIWGKHNWSPKCETQTHHLYTFRWFCVFCVLLITTQATLNQQSVCTPCHPCISGWDFAFPLCLPPNIHLGWQSWMWCDTLGRTWPKTKFKIRFLLLRLRTQRILTTNKHFFCCLNLLYDLALKLLGTPPLADALEAVAVAAVGQDAESALAGVGLLKHHLHANTTHHVLTALDGEWNLHVFLMGFNACLPSTKKQQRDTDLFTLRLPWQHQL